MTDTELDKLSLYFYLYLLATYFYTYYCMTPCVPGLHIHLYLYLYEFFFFFLKVIVHPRLSALYALLAIK